MFSIVKCQFLPLCTKNEKKIFSTVSLKAKGYHSPACTARASAKWHRHVQSQFWRFLSFVRTLNPYFFTHKMDHSHLLVLQNREVKKGNTMAIYFEQNNWKPETKRKMPGLIQCRLQQSTFSPDKVKFKDTVRVIMVSFEMLDCSFSGCTERWSQAVLQRHCVSWQFRVHIWVS